MVPWAGEHLISSNKPAIHNGLVTDLLGSQTLLYLVESQLDIAFQPQIYSSGNRRNSNADMRAPVSHKIVLTRELAIAALLSTRKSGAVVLVGGLMTIQVFRMLESTTTGLAFVLEPSVVPAGMMPMTLLARILCQGSTRTPVPQPGDRVKCPFATWVCALVLCIALHPARPPFTCRTFNNCPVGL